jgi:hypothetical protein
MPQATLALALAFLAAGDSAHWPPSQEPARLALAQLYVSTEHGARVAPDVEALRGRRVSTVGFMVRMEQAPKGAFYLTRQPAESDEGGAGTGDLPPGALRVEVPQLGGEEIAWVADVVEAIGTLEVGRAEDPDGRVSWLRVVVDARDAAAAPARKTSAREGADGPATNNRR